MRKTLLITGATSGFGEATARRFAEDGHPMILTGRRGDRLEKMKDEYSTKFGNEIHTLCFDVRDQQAVIAAIGSLDGRWKKIDVLVNNAGLASGLDFIQDGDTEDWDKMIDTNVKGLLYVSNEVIKLMKAQGSGHIINIGSTAGKEVYPKGNVYCASKHAVDAITKGMRIDLLPLGIKVTQIAPGAADTEFSLVRFHGDQEKADSVYNGYKPMSAKDIAEMIHFTAMLPPHLCVNDLVVTAIAQANSYCFHKTAE